MIHPAIEKWRATIKTREENPYAISDLRYEAGEAWYNSLSLPQRKVLAEFAVHTTLEDIAVLAMNEFYDD